MNFNDFTAVQQEQIKQALTGMCVNSRYGVIPSIELPSKNYVLAINNSLLNCIEKLEQLIKITNKKTKKYAEYLNKLDRLQLHSRNMQLILERI